MISKTPVILIFTVRATRADGYTLAVDTTDLGGAERMVAVCAKRGYDAYIHVSREQTRAVMV